MGAKNVDRVMTAEMLPRCFHRTAGLRFYGSPVVMKLYVRVRRTMIRINAIFLFQCMGISLLLVAIHDEVVSEDAFVRCQTFDGPRAAVAERAV